MAISWTGPGNPYLKNSVGLTAAGLALPLTPLLFLPLEGTPAGNEPPNGAPGAEGAAGAGVEDEEPQKKSAAPERERAGMVMLCLNMSLVTGVIDDKAKEGKEEKRRVQSKRSKKRKKRGTTGKVFNRLFFI